MHAVEEDFVAGAEATQGQVVALRARLTGTDGTRRLTSDVNRAVDGLPEAAVRLNMMVDENGVADRNSDTYRRFGFALSIALGLGTPTRFILSYLHQQSYDTPD